MGTTVAIDMSFVLLVLGCLALLASGQECDVGGECVGTLLGFASTASITECLVQCKETANCTWFTHNGPDSFCAVYETCESVDATACPECISGERSCPVTNWGLVCELPGLCEGEIIHEDLAETIVNCESQCNAFTGCNAYTFDSANKYCMLFNTCPALSDQQCEGCTTSQSGCISNTKARFLMVTGGGSYNELPQGPNGPVIDPYVALLSLDGESPVPECLQNLTPPPIGFAGSCPGTLGDGKLPHICGGLPYVCDETGYCDRCDDLDGIDAPPQCEQYDKCHRYNPDQDTWTVSGDMLLPTWENTACAVSSVPEIIMNGDPNSFQQEGTTTLYTKDGETFGSLPPMPGGGYPSERHCAVSLDGDDLFVAGGSNPLTYIYFKDTMQWEFQRDMPNPRDNLMCGLVHNEAGEQEVVTAGGYGGDETVVEIFNVRSGQWRSGNPLPRSIEGAAVVPLDDTFLIVGGLDYIPSNPCPLGPCPLDTIYKYNQADDSWTLQEAKLPYPVHKPVAMMVDRDIFSSC